MAHPARNWHLGEFGLPRPQVVARRHAALARRNMVFARTLGLVVLGFVVSSVGCAPFSLLRDQLQYCVPVDEFITSHRGRVSAGEAWRRYVAECGEPEDARDFESGFRAGYLNVSRGEKGCRPPLPPRQYWGAKFETPEGRNRISTWFSGFDQGVIAASEDGAGEFRRLPPTTKLVAPLPPEFDQTPTQANLARIAAGARRSDAVSAATRRTGSDAMTFPAFLVPSKAYQGRVLASFLTLSIVWATSGCTALLSPIHSVPARLVPDELLAEPRNNLQPIDLARLRQEPPADYRLDTGDVLSVYIEGVLGTPESPAPVHFPMAGSDVKPSFGYPVPVREDGTISLPLVPPIQVRGMTETEAEQRVRSVYLDEEKILRREQDRTALALLRKRTSRVIVVREDGQQELALPGGRQGGRITAGAAETGRGFVVDLPAYENDVMHALAQTGGLPGLNSRSEIKIWRRKAGDWHERDQFVRAYYDAHAGDRCPYPIVPPDDESVVRIPLRLPPGETPKFQPKDVLLHDGDIIYVESRDAEVFYTGGLLPAGQFPLPRDYDLDVLSAVAVAGKGLGANPSGGIIGGLGGASPTKLYVIRRTANGSQVTIAVDLDRAITNPRERLLIHPGDVLILRYSAVEETANFALFTFFTYGIQQLFTN